MLSYDTMNKILVKINLDFGVTLNLQMTKNKSIQNHPPKPNSVLLLRKCRDYIISICKNYSRIN